MDGNCDSVVFGLHYYLCETWLLFLAEIATPEPDELSIDRVFIELMQSFALV